MSHRRSSPEIIMVTIETLTSTTFDIMINSKAKIKDIKRHIFYVTKIPVEEQSLLFENQELLDYRLISDYNVKNGNKLKLITQLKGGPITYRRPSPMYSLMALLNSVSKINQSSIDEDEDLDFDLFEENEDFDEFDADDEEDDEFTEAQQDFNSNKKSSGKKKKNVEKQENNSKEPPSQNINATNEQDPEPEPPHKKPKPKGFTYFVIHNGLLVRVAAFDTNSQSEEYLTQFEKEAKEDPEERRKREEERLKEDEKMREKMQNLKKNMHDKQLEKEKLKAKQEINKPVNPIVSSKKKETLIKTSRISKNYSNQHKPAPSNQFKSNTERKNENSEKKERKSDKKINNKEGKEIKNSTNNREYKPNTRESYHLKNETLNIKHSPFHVTSSFQATSPYSNLPKATPTDSVVAVKDVIRKSLGYDENFNKQKNFISKSLDLQPKQSPFNDQFYSKKSTSFDYGYTKEIKSFGYHAFQGSDEFSKKKHEKSKDQKYYSYPAMSKRKTTSDMRNVGKDLDSDTIWRGSKKSSEARVEDLLAFMNKSIKEPLPRQVSDHTRNSRKSQILKSLSITKAELHSQDEKKKSISPQRTRCSFCKKVIGITNTYHCKCGQLFCHLHKFPEEHSCPYDYKKEGRDKMKKNNPKVDGSKVHRI